MLQQVCCDSGRSIGNWPTAADWAAWMADTSVPNLPIGMPQLPNASHSAPGTVSLVLKGTILFEVQPRLVLSGNIVPLAARLVRRREIPLRSWL